MIGKVNRVKETGQWIKFLCPENKKKFEYMSTEKKVNKSGDKRGLSEGSKKHYIEPRWKPGESGNPKGRPKSRSRELLNELLTVKQVKENTMLDDKEIDAIETIIMSMGLPELQAIAKSEKAPAYMITLARAAMWDMKNGKTHTMNLLRDRQFGAVKKQVDVTTNGESMLPQSMTPDEAKEMLKRIEESC